MMNFKGKIAIVTAIILMASGCASNKDAGVSYAEMAAKQYEKEAEIVEEQLDSIPDWFLEPDEFDENGFYAVSMGKSPDMNMAIRMGRLEAKKMLAGNVSELISAQEKMFSKGTSDNAGTTMQSVIESFINEADVAGTVYDKKELTQVGSSYVYYTRAYLPVKAIKEMQEKAQFAADLNTASLDAQQELMLRVAQAKKAAVAEQDARTAKIQAEADRKAALLLQQAQVSEIAQ